LSGKIGKEEDGRGIWEEENRGLERTEDRSEGLGRIGRMR